MSVNMATLSGAETDLREIAEDVIARAMKGGACAADAIVRDGSEFSTVVRMGEVESLKEADSRGVGLRVFLGKHAASTYSSDFSREGIDRLVRGALDLAKVTSEDPCAGLPDPSELGSFEGELKLYHDDVHSLPPEERIDYARRAERAALEADPRIKNSEGGSFDATTGRKVLANSLGFIGDYRRSYCSIMAGPIAQDENGAMQRDFWYSAARSLVRLQSPESVGREAARRAVRRLGARKISSTRVPIVFDRTVASSLLEHISEAASGDAIYRHSSFLVGKLGEKIAGENVTIVDDGAMPGGFGTTPFDGEGVPTRKTVVVEQGVLKSYLLNTYTARKLGLKTTGNAARGLTGNPGIGSGNFFLQPGTHSPQQIIAEIKRGFFVTEFLGFGVNLVTGDFSRGAAGLWIEDGELTFPVEEVTVAGNFKDMLNNISEIGSDLEFRSSTACPTLRIDGMTLAGE
ncbi:MAG TPA: metallopeptidase TldD-related protein [Candidatus Angelobacter sp.]|nr:metallopeptidase TldD-related protein [Candidatus Angelobacter sp.]